MTLAARHVLEDCTEALHEFAGDLHGARWRIIYMANIALLRTVYPVLKNRDAPANPRLRAVFSRWDNDLWSTKPSPEIYWEFIVSERNQLLKEYTATPVRIAPVAEIHFNLSTGETKDMGTVRQQYLMAEGPFAGQEQRHLIKQAIQWWYAQLEQLDRAARTR